MRDSGLFLKSTENAEGIDSDLSKPRSLPIEASQNVVVHLDIAANVQDRPVLVIQVDGTTTLASSNLDHSASTTLAGFSSAGSHNILAAAILSPTDARKTVLKAREDLSRDLSQDAVILAAVYKTSATNQEFHYGTWVLTKNHGELESSQLFAQALHNNRNDSGKRLPPSTVSFGHRTTTILIKSVNGIRRFDITGLVPRHLPNPKPTMLGHLDSISLSSGLTLNASQDALRLLDSEYGAVLASLDLNQTLLRRKRKRNGTEISIGAIDFVTYFAKSSRVVLFSRSHLIACDIKLGESKTSDAYASLLVNNIGRGNSHTHQQNRSLQLFVTQDTELEDLDLEWAGVQDSLEKIRQGGNVLGFQTRLLKYLRQRHGEGSHNGSTIRLSSAQINYILSAIFSRDQMTADAPGAGLHSRSDVPRLLKWLIKAGYMSRRHVQDALLPEPSPERRLDYEDLALAMLEADPSYAILSDYLQNSADIELAESAKIARLLLLRVLQQYTTTARQLTGADTDGTSSALAAQDQSAEQDRPLLQALTDALSSMGTADARSVSSLIRTTFAGGEVLALIQFLRQQLFTSGYPGSGLQSNDVKAVSQKDNGVSSEAKPRSSDFVSRQMDVDVILKLLSACIDSFGPLDLLSIEESDVFVETVIPDLLSEISLATQAAEESSDIHGTLRETIRYIESDKPSKRQSRSHFKQIEPTQQHPGEIITLYSENMEDDLPSEATALLPLSLHADDTISPIRLRKGGGQTSTRSLRHTLALESRQKGLYSFERLVL